MIVPILRSFDKNLASLCESSQWDDFFWTYYSLTFDDDLQIHETSEYSEFVVS